MNKDAQGRWKVGMSNIKLKIRDKMLWSRESIYQEANPEVTALARRGAA